MLRSQDLIRGLCLRPKVPFHREVTATAARTTAPAAACTSTAATRRCLPTNSASSMTFTATMSAPGPGQSSRTAHMLLCLFIVSCSRVDMSSTRVQVHPERERLPPVLALSCASQRHPAHLWGQHAQRHVAQQRSQVFLCRLPGL